MEVIQGRAIKTPVRRLYWLERYVGVPVYAKLESQQHTGSFKFRGAYYALHRNGTTRPVIAASAGNHGLAVAEVARQLGVPANICIPTTASRLKREHIVATGAGLIEHGNSLEEAIEHALKLARSKGHYFISPYNNPDVIAGNATISIELLNEVPEIKSLVVPVGGGGLISGMALGAACTGRTLDVFGCEPARYDSLTRSLKAGEIVRVVHQPTLADGLAVNLEPNSITFELVSRHVQGIVCLSEEELAASTLAMLVHESLLVEPAGAAAIVACIRLSQKGRLRGPVGIPICGGNLHHIALSRIQRFPYSDPLLLRLLDLRGRRAVDLPVARTRLSHDETAQADIATPQAALIEQLRLCIDDIGLCSREISDFEQYCCSQNLLFDEKVVHALAQEIETIAASVRQAIQLLEEGDAEQDSDRLAIGESALRWGLSTIAYVRGSLEWCSPSYDQSRVTQFYNLGAQNNPTVNYERYESAAVQRIESQLVGVLGLPPEEFAVTVTSSGMAAYMLIESFLLRERLAPGATVLLAPYIYFEASEQLTSLRSVRCVWAKEYEVASMLALVAEHRPSVVFLDSLANTATQRMIDLPAFVAGLRRQKLGPMTLVIDGTMISGGVSLEVIRGGDGVEVLYYESCSKYLQLGLDASMAGLVAYPVEARATFERLRRNCGSILYKHGAHLFPVYDRTRFHQRMLRISNNALRVASLLSQRKQVLDLVEVIYPGLPSHPDHAVAQRLPYAGGCVTFLFREPGMNHRDQLEAVIEEILERARPLGLHLTKGVSFGFSAPRISAAASMAESEPPFLRLYVGDRGARQADLLAHVLIEVMESMSNE
ncbi:pyridoxal-phosphate dependent enzyme [Sorangium sp. So ce281]|uniref:pyridoxal-phosphate dependent enzyme n=1 Tax=unclassified Sorangium TaxID=2621164 RepID=UPI003F5FF2DE